MKRPPPSDVILILLLATAFFALMLLFLGVRSITSDYEAKDTLAAVAGLCFSATAVSLLWAITRKTVVTVRQTGLRFTLCFTRRRAAQHLALALAATVLLHAGFYLYASKQSQALISRTHANGGWYSCEIPSGTEAPVGFAITTQRLLDAGLLCVAFHPPRSEPVSDWYKQKVQVLAQQEITLFVRKQGLTDDRVRSLVHDAANPPALKLVNAKNLRELTDALERLFPQIRSHDEVYADFENIFSLRVFNVRTPNAFAMIDGATAPVRFQVEGDTLWLDSGNTRWWFRPDRAVRIPKHADTLDSIDTRFHPFGTLPRCLLIFFLASAALFTPFLYVVRRRGTAQNPSQ